MKPSKSFSSPGLSGFHFMSAYSGLAYIVLAVALFSSTPALRAQGWSRLDGSVKSVPETGQTAPDGGFHAQIVSHTLTARHGGATMVFEVSLKMRNFSDLTARIHTGETVSTDEMFASYYPLASDYQKVVDWLTSMGFTITHQDPRRLAVFASGTVHQISKAFHLSFARVAASDGEYTSAISAPVVPADIAAVIVGINGLQPHIHMRAQDTTSFNPPYTPSQMAQAYGANTLSVNGTGQVIAVITAAFPPSTSDLTQFWTTVGVSQSLSNIQFIPVNGGPPSNSLVGSPWATGGSITRQNQGEAVLDVESTSGLAAGAKVRDYGTPDAGSVSFDLAFQQILNDQSTNPGLNQVSISFGEGEADLTNSVMQTEDQYLAALANAGITVFAGSGDNGSDPDSNGVTQAEFPASDPNVTGVGGTNLTLNSSTGAFISETCWALNSGGGTSGYFSRPSWQTGTGVPTGTMRCVPDVASLAGNGFLCIENGSQVSAGGTSLSSPTWAGWCALINQARTTEGLPPVGLLGPQIYPLIGTSSFRDITSGSNGAYSAGVGYDLCTGIGTPNVANLLSALSVGFTTQPASQTVNVGANVTFTCLAAVVSGHPAPSYQWYKGATAIAGQTSTTLTLTNVQLSAAASYSVSATSGTAYALSNAAILTVGLTPQTVTISPASTSVAPGTAVTFTASGGQNGYTWGGSAGGSGATQSVTFSTAGTFTVTVLSPASSTFAQSNTATATITVAAPSPAPASGGGGGGAFSDWFMGFLAIAGLVRKAINDRRLSHRGHQLPGLRI